MNFGGTKCVAGDQNGPTLRNNYGDLTIKNRDFYYYKGKCYGNCERSSVANPQGYNLPNPAKPTCSPITGTPSPILPLPYNPLGLNPIPSQCPVQSSEIANRFSDYSTYNSAPFPIQSASSASWDSLPAELLPIGALPTPALNQNNEMQMPTSSAGNIVLDSSVKKFLFQK